MQQDDSVVTDSRRRQRLAPEQRREQLIDATASLVEREGVAAVTMARVAEEASASRSLLYLYFQTRTDLLIALLAREFGYINTTAAAVVHGTGSFEDKLLAGFHLFVETFGERGPAIRSVLHHPSVNEVLESSRVDRQRTHTAFWADLFEQELSLTHDEAMLVGAMFLAVNQSVGTAWLEGEVDRETAEALFSRFVLDGLRGFTPTNGRVRRRSASRRP